MLSTKNIIIGLAILVLCYIVFTSIFQTKIKRKAMNNTVENSTLFQDISDLISGTCNTLAIYNNTLYFNS